MSDNPGLVTTKDVECLAESFENLKRLIGMRQALVSLPECEFRDALIRLVDSTLSGVPGNRETQEMFTGLSSLSSQDGVTLTELNRLRLRIRELEEQAAVPQSEPPSQKGLFRR